MFIQHEAKVPQSVGHLPLDGGVDLRDLGADPRAEDRFVGCELCATYAVALPTPTVNSLS
tara:strand:- start:287 stop:466 length:180 start_codon:yes stop_codon:yes gene_type:complete